MLYLTPVGSEGGELDVSSSLRIFPFFWELCKGLRDRSQLHQGSGCQEEAWPT